MTLDTQILLQDSVCYFLIAYLVKLWKMSIIPFKLNDYDTVWETRTPLLVSLILPVCLMLWPCVKLS